jgi:antitoxin VapB
MGTQLNIKSEDPYRLASRLAALTGESLTTAVTNALRSADSMIS